MAKHKPPASPLPQSVAIRDRIVELRRVPANELQANPANWRKHPEAQMSALAGVLSEIGFAGAELCRQLPDGSLMLIDGHARANLMGEQLVPCLVTDLSEGEANTLLAAFDPLGAMATADTEKLDALLREVQTGEEAVAKMLQDLAKEAGCAWAKEQAGEIIEDEVPEVPTEPVTKPGDLWVMGEHRLLCGDSTNAEDVGRLLNGAKPFLMVTDPPYGVEYDPAWRNDAAAKGLISFAARREGAVENDDRVDWTEAYRMFPGHVAYVWHDGRHAADLVVNLRDASFEIRTQIIWRKPAFAISRGHYHWQHEPCWYAVRQGGSAKWCGDRSQSTVWDISNRVNQNDNSNHGTQKPIECMARPIRNHGGNDDDVYDPFCGSGTTIIAAEQLNRRCYACEISPQYVDVSLLRWMNLTGKQPVLQETGETFEQAKRRCGDAKR